jgi:hypothetical protein
MRTGPMPKADRIGPCQIAGQPFARTSLSVKEAMLERCLAIGNYYDPFIKRLK